MKVLVCGGRDYTDFDSLAYFLDAFHSTSPITTLIHGGSRGADLMAGAWAASRKVPCVAHPAEWHRYRHSAGSIRNQKMLDVEHPELVIAFPGGPGTADMMRRAQTAGVPVMRAP